MKDNTGQVLVQAPVEIANFLLNEKRGALREIEARHDAPIVIVADEQLHTPHYEVTRVRENELGEESNKPSYQRGTPRKLATISLTKANLNVPAAPVVKNVKPAQPAPLREPRPEPVQAATSAPVPAFAAKPASPGFVGWLKGLFGGAEPAPQPRAPEPRERGDRNDRNGQRRDQRDGRGNRQNQGGRDGRRDERRGQQQPQQKQQQQPKREDGNKPSQQQQQKPKQERQRQEQQAKPQDSSRQQPQQPAKEAPKPRVETVQPPVRSDEAAIARNDEVVAMPTRAPVPSVDPAADAVHAIAEANEAATATDPAADDTNGEGGSRRRRGRRGGRRRRKQGAEGAAAAGIEDHDADENIAASLQSQPEFDFADAQPAPPSVTPAGKDSSEAAGADASTRASMATHVSDIPMPATESPAVEPVPAQPVHAIEPVAPVVGNVAVENTTTEPALATIEAAVASEAAPAAIEPIAAVEAPPVAFVASDSRMAVQPAPSPTVADAGIEPVVQIEEADADALAVVEPAAVSNVEADAEAKDSREESPLA